MNTKKEKILYDAVLNLLVSTNCNFSCQYCIAKPRLNNLKTDSINIPAFLKVLESTGKTFNINFYGFGEPFLMPNLIEVCEAITRKHYISLITNLTSPRIKEFAERINPERVIKINASVHVKELESKGLLETYFDNLSLLQNKGFAVIVFEVAYPSIFNEVDKYKKLFAERGVRLYFSSFFGDYQGKKYPQSYTKEEIKTFGIFPKLSYQYKLFCNAGYNSGIVLPNGDVEVCGDLKENIGNIYKEIKFNKKLVVCPFKFCPCPPTVNDLYLFKKALEEAVPLYQRLIYYFKNSRGNVNQPIKVQIFLSKNIDQFIGKIGMFLKKNFPKLYFKLRELKKS